MSGQSMLKINPLTCRLAAYIWAKYKNRGLVETHWNRNEKSIKITYYKWTWSQIY